MKHILYALCLLCIPHFAQAGGHWPCQDTPQGCESSVMSSQTATCFTAHNYDDGSLCFSIPPDSVAAQSPVQVTIDDSSQSATYTYTSLGTIEQHRCIHKKEGPHCFDVPVLMFRRLILGGVEDIELELPGLDRGEARIGGISYDLSRSSIKQALAAHICTRNPSCCPPLGITDGCN